jgi:hypothetical protein
MIGSKVAKRAVVALAIAVGLMACAATARADGWVYRDYDGFGNWRKNDKFYRAVDGNWYETSGGTIINQFQQFQSNDGSIFLENTVTRCRIWIYTDATYIEWPLGTGKRYYAPGWYYR